MVVHKYMHIHLWIEKGHSPARASIGDAATKAEAKNNDDAMDSLMII